MSSPYHPWRTLLDSTSPFFLYFSFLSFSVYFLYHELFLELDNPIVMASLRYSAADESEDILNSFNSHTAQETEEAAPNVETKWWPKKCLLVESIKSWRERRLNRRGTFSSRDVEDVDHIKVSCFTCCGIFPEGTLGLSKRNCKFPLSRKRLRTTPCRCNFRCDEGNYVSFGQFRMLEELSINQFGVYSRSVGYGTQPVCCCMSFGFSCLRPWHGLSCKLGGVDCESLQERELHKTCATRTPPCDRGRIPKSQKKFNQAAYFLWREDSENLKIILILEATVPIGRAVVIVVDVAIYDST